MSKYSVGQKFIIEIEDVLHIDSDKGIRTLPWYMVNGLEGTFFEEDDLDSLERYDGAEGVWNAGYKTGYDKGYQEGAQNPSSIGYDHGYEAGLNDAWECARQIIDMEWKEKRAVLGINTLCLSTLFTRLTASEAMKRIREHKDEIRVGDILRHDTTETEEMVVTRVHDEYVSGVCIKGTINQVGATFFDKPKGRWVKTGRHFPIEDILEQMRSDRNR